MKQIVECPLSRLMPVPNEPLEKGRLWLIETKTPHKIGIRAKSLFYKNGNDSYSTEGIRVEFNDGTTFDAQIDSNLAELSAKIIRGSASSKDNESRQGRNNNNAELIEG